MPGRGPRVGLPRSHDEIRSVMPEESRRILKPLDARAPLVLDTRELGRRPGVMRRISRTVQALAGLDVDVMSVPVGTGIELEIRLESVIEGVLVSGSARSAAVGECVRCLDGDRKSVV